MTKGGLDTIMLNNLVSENQDALAALLEYINYIESDWLCIHYIKLSKYKINVNLMEGVSIVLLLHGLLKKQTVNIYSQYKYLSV